MHILHAVHIFGDPMWCATSLLRWCVHLPWQGFLGRSRTVRWCPGQCTEKLWGQKNSFVTSQMWSNIRLCQPVSQFLFTNNSKKLQLFPALVHQQREEGRKRRRRLFRRFALFGNGSNRWWAPPTVFKRWILCRFFHDFFLLKACQMEFYFFWWTQQHCNFDFKQFEGEKVLF